MQTFIMARGDFRERRRRFSFWALLAISLYIAVICAPHPGSVVKIFSIEPQIYAQRDNPTWLPMGIAFVLGIFIPLLGFVYARSSISSDIAANVLSLFQSTRFPRMKYVFSKFISNLMILFSILLAMVAGTLMMIMIQFPGQGMPVWSFLSPFLALCPGLFFAAAAAVFMESAAFLRAKGPTILVTIAFLVLVVSTSTASVPAVHSFSSIMDVTGFGLLMEAVRVAGLRTNGYKIQYVSVLSTNHYKHLGHTELVFSGIPIASGKMVDLGILLLLSVGLVIAAGFLLEQRPVAVIEKRNRLGKNFQSVCPDLDRPPVSQWTPVVSARHNFVRIVGSELKRLVKSMTASWLVAGAVIWGINLFVSREMNLKLFLPLMFGWGMLPLSMLGCEEKESGVFQWLRTIEGAPLRQLAASFCGGLLLSLVMVLPVLLHFIGSAGMIALLAWAVMVPAAAMLLGSCTRSPRTFQVLFILVLYFFLNSPQHFVPLGLAASIRTACVYGAVAVVSLVLLVLEGVKAEH